MELLFLTLVVGFVTNSSWQQKCWVWVVPCLRAGNMTFGSYFHGGAGGSGFSGGWEGQGQFGWLCKVVLKSYPRFCPSPLSKLQDPCGRGRAKSASGWDAAEVPQLGQPPGAEPAFCIRCRQQVWGLTQFYGWSWLDSGFSNTVLSFGKMSPSPCVVLVTSTLESTMCR